MLVPFLSHASDQIKVCHPISNESDAIARPNPMEVLSHQVEAQLDSATETDIRVSLNFGATWDQKQCFKMAATELEKLLYKQVEDKSELRGCRDYGLRTEFGAMRKQ